MAVYVDDLWSCLKIHRWRSSSACHMFADTREELCDMALAIGLAQRYIQEKVGRPPHFDLFPSKRKLAVKAGAVELSCSEMGHWLQKQKASMGMPCSMGCQSHVSHPCEKCGQQWAV